MTIPRRQYAEKRNEGGTYREAKARKAKGRKKGQELLNGFPVSRRCNALLSLGS